MSDTISTLAAKLRPHWLRDLSSNITAVSAAGTPGVTDHGALSGLMDDDHPQYLNAVRGDARYLPATGGANYQYIGTGSGTTAAWRNVSEFAGSGLTAATGVLAVGVANTGAAGLTVEADAVRLTSSSDVGTTPAAAILASTAGGALTLSSLFVKGSVSLTNNGDLTVAGSGSYAGNTVLFADSSGGNVGIMMIPDPQFALDVNGPARATYFVGPHAIQLKNVLLLSHFDGRLPYATNYYGEPNGHMGQIATVAGSVVYKAGKYYKALQTGPTTLNRVTNPSFETGTTGWAYSDSNSSGSMVRSSYNSYAGSYSLQLFNATAGQDDFAYFQVSGLSASTAYTVSAYAYVTDEFGGGASSNRGLYALDTNSAGTAQVSTITGSTDGQWVRHTVTVTMSGSPGNLQVRLYNPKGRTYWDAVQVELSGGATGYADGDMPGHTWTGTAHASTSNRTTTAYLTYPTAGNVNALRGTIMAWVYPYSAFGAGTIWRITGSVAGYIILRTNGYNLESFWGTSQLTGTGALTPNAWMHVAMTYDSTTLRLYVNGAEVANAATSGFDTLPASMFIGSADGTNSPMSMLLDDFCILDRTAPATEIRSVYESNAPVFAESSTFSFRPTPKGLIWADDEGFWMKATDGDTVLGVYGNDAQTKSWGGQTMSAGDLLIGNATNYVFWNDDVATLTISGTVTAGAGAIGGWTIGATALTAGSGANTVGLDSGGTNPAIYAGSATPGSAPFRVTKAGALTATSATITGSILASSGGISGNFYVGSDVGASGNLYVGSNGSMRFANDGVRAVLASTDGPYISSSSSAFRWFSDISINSVTAGATSTNYCGFVAYRHNSYNTVDLVMESYVGNASAPNGYQTLTARTILQAGHSDGTYTSARLEVVREAGSGLKYVGVYGDRLEVNGAIGAATMTAPGASWGGGSLLYTDTADGDLKVRFANGTVKTLATN